MKRKSPGAAVASVAAAPRAEGKRKVKTPPWMTITIDDSSDEDGATVAANKRVRAASSTQRAGSGSAPAASGSAGANACNKPVNAGVANDSSLAAQLAASQQRVAELQNEADAASQRLVGVRSQLAEREKQVKVLQCQLNELEDAVLCPICMEQRRSVAFSCGHTSCAPCSGAVKDCHTCRKKITKRLALF